MQHLTRIVLSVIVLAGLLALGGLVWLKRRDFLPFLYPTAKQNQPLTPLEHLQQSEYWLDLGAFANDPGVGFTQLDWAQLLKDSTYDFMIAPPNLLTQSPVPVIIDLTATEDVAAYDPATVPQNVTVWGVKVTNDQARTVASKLPADWVVLINNFDKVPVDQLTSTRQAISQPVAGLSSETNLPNWQVPADQFLTLRTVAVNCQSKLETCLKNTQWVQRLTQVAQQAHDQKYRYRFALACPQCSIQEKLLFSQLPHVNGLQVVTEVVPMVTWNVRYPNSLWQQSAYSLQYNQITTEGQEVPFWKTGIVGAVNTGEAFVPVKQPGADRFTVKLRWWVGFAEHRWNDAQEQSAQFEHSFTVLAINTSIKTSDLNQAAWVPEWGHPVAIESFKQNPTYWDELNPVWYLPQKDGSLKPTDVSNSPELTALIKQNKIKVLPSLPIFDVDVLSEILHNHLDDHVAAILKVVDQYNYDGIDLDYEATYVDDKALLEEFVGKLADGLHQRNKRLIFTALPKWSDRDVYSFLPQTHQAQDWEKLGKMADELRVMAYDFTPQGNTRPGPLSPLIWDDLILKYAVSKVSKEKIGLALPLYSHSWAATLQSLDAGSKEDPTGPSNDQSIYEQEKQTYSFTATQIKELSGLSGYQEKIDDWNKEMVATYQDHGDTRTMFYLNKDMIELRQKLAAQYGIRGLGYWRLGGEILQ